MAPMISVNEWTAQQSASCVNPYIQANKINSIPLGGQQLTEIVGEGEDGLELRHR